MKTSFKFHMQAKKKPVAVYVVVIYSLILLDRFIELGFFTGIELAGMLFMFIVGLMGFKDEFKMLQQNGKTRNQVFVAALFSFLVFSVLFTFMNYLTVEALKIYTNYSTGDYGLLFYLYRSFILYCCFGLFGYGLSALYYRLGKGGKILLSVSIPILLSFVLPRADDALLRGKLHTWFVQIIDFTQNEIAAVPFISLSLFALIVASVISWLVIRRTPVK